MSSRIAMVIGAGAAACITGAAAGQLNPIGPFTGDSTEHFDGKRVIPAPPCVDGRVFDMRADLCTPSGGMLVSGGWGFSCTIRPFLGSHFVASTGGESVYEFDVPVERFGGYFGTNSSSPDGTAEFYDESGALLGSDVIRFPADCTWHWAGWGFGRPVERIVIRSNRPNGDHIMMDEMEVDWSGAPTCYPDCDNNGTLDFFDFLCFQNAFLAQDPYADCDENGVFDFFDFLCFQNEFLAGCP